MYPDGSWPGYPIGWYGNSMLCRGLYWTESIQIDWNRTRLGFIDIFEKVVSKEFFAKMSRVSMRRIDRALEEGDGKISIEILDAFSFVSHISVDKLLVCKLQKNIDCRFRIPPKRIENQKELEDWLDQVSAFDNLDQVSAFDNIESFAIKIPPNSWANCSNELKLMVTKYP